MLCGQLVAFSLVLDIIRDVLKSRLIERKCCKIRLILNKLKAPSNIRGIKKHIVSTLTILVFLGVFGLADVSTAEAGFFSFIDKFFGGNQKETEIVVQNSQTATLLKSIINPDPSAGKGGGGISIVNQSALLADTGPLGSIADIEERISNSDRISVYVVREGDSLSQIAKMFGVSINTIIWANDITRGDLIRTGQVLIILPVTGIKYTVKSGDTVYSIAKKYKGDVQEIMEYNDLSSSASLVVGEEIMIPDGEAAYQPVYSNTSTLARGTGGPNYNGYYLRPISGGRKSQNLHGYNAVDLATYCGAPILASATGDVIISKSYGWNGGYGNYIVISHTNGTQTLYAHNGSNIVSGGWHVVKGQVIGYVGSTGKSTGCHVHFEIRGAKNPF
ncbi:LysM peptidoglycan-binding domain-containing protein [Patescibacteria group bacterium]